MSPDVRDGFVIPLRDRLTRAPMFMVTRQNVCLAFRTPTHPASRRGQHGDVMGGFVWVHVPTGAAINPLLLMRDGTLYDPLRRGSRKVG